MNNFTIVLNDSPIECNKKFIKSNFPNLLRACAFGEDQIKIQIDGSEDFLEVTTNILQGNNYEITDDNLDYLEEFAKYLESSNFRTQLNQYYYKRECNDNQIDQCPSIQYLVELSSLIHKLTFSNYEDISEKIKQKIISRKNKSKKKKRGKKQDKKSNDEANNDDNKIILQNMGKKSLNKLFYYEIVNCLSSSFHTSQELKEHQQKIQLIIQIIKELDSEPLEEEEDGEENKEKTYIGSFINYVIKKYSKVKSCSSTINNHRQETFYIIHYLLSNKLITIADLQNKKEKTDIIFNDYGSFSIPRYFLSFYPSINLDQYFKLNSSLLAEVEEDNNNNSEKPRKGRKKKNIQPKSDTSEGKIDRYLRSYQKKIEEGFSFNDELLNIVINDNLEDFKSYFQSRSSINQAGKSNENYLINSYLVPNDILQFSCISALNNSSLLELSAFFGSKDIFRYLNDKQLNNEIRKSDNLLSYIISGQNSHIINIYIESLENQERERKRKIEEEKKKKLEELKKKAQQEQEQQTISKDDSENEEEDPTYEENQSNSDHSYEDNESRSGSDSDSDNNNNNNNHRFNYNFIGKRIRQNFIQNSNDDYNNESNPIIKDVKSLIKYCIDYGNYDSYIFLTNYLSDHKEEEEHHGNHKKLDQYLKKCISRSYFSFIPNLLERGSTTNILLNLFCKMDNEIGIEYMLQFSYIDVNTKYLNQSPLEYCIKNKNSQASLLLLSNDKFDLQKDEKSRTHYSQLASSDGETLLQLACKLGLSDLVEYFLQKKIFNFNATSTGFSAVQLACLSGDTDTFQKIVEYKRKSVKINVRVKCGEYKGFTLLHLACVSGNPEIVEILLEYEKIKVNIRDGIKKWTPLQHAISKGHSEVVSLLLNRDDIETDLLTDEGETLLHLACKSNKEDIVDMLINNPDFPTKYDLNQRTNNQKTPLQFALMNGNINMISVLMNIDATAKPKRGKKGQKKKNSKTQSEIDPNMHTSNGKTPLIMACEMRRADIIELLLKHTEIEINDKLFNGKTALFVSCDLNIIDSVKALLNFDNIDINAATKEGKTPLIAACEKGNKEIVELLIDYNNQKGKKSSLIDINAKTNNGKTALLVSCEYSQMEIAELLFQFDDIDCDSSSVNPKTPLCYACENGCENLVINLLDRNANANFVTTSKETPLYFACASRNKDIVELILAHLEDKSIINLQETKQHKSPLFVACFNGDLDIFNLLINELDENPDLSYTDSQERTLLHAACYGENYEIIKTLLTKFNFDPNIDDRSNKRAIHICCKKGNFDLVDLIINRSSIPVDLNVRYNSKTPLEIACENGNYEIVQLLLRQNGIQVNATNANEVPPLLLASKNWNPKIIKLLLSEVNDVNVDALDYNGKTVLHYVCEKNEVELCEKILSISSQSINKRSNDLNTPIQLAINRRNLEIVKILMKYISSDQINFKFNDDNTLLSTACLNNDVETVKYLLEKEEIEVNEPNKSGSTPLFIVATNGNQPICRLLLSNKNIDIEKTTNQKTPLYQACRCGNTRIAELLVEKGATVNCLTKSGKTPLHAACQYGYYKIVSILLNVPNIEVNLLTSTTGQTFKTFKSPLHYACMGKARNQAKKSTRGDFSSQKACVEFLIHHPQIDINLQTSNNETALQIAMDDNNFEIMKVLLQHPQIDPNVTISQNKTSLHLACENSQKDIIQMLLSNPATNVNCIDTNGQTPISIAVDHSRIDIINLLMNRPDLKVSLRSQRNPIKSAIDKSNQEIFSLLIHHPSFDINQIDKRSMTPLGYAINSQNSDFIYQLLLVPGIDVNLKVLSANDDRRKENGSLLFLTPMNLAIKLNNFRIVKMLTQNESLKLNGYIKGKTVLQETVIANNASIASVLLSTPNIDPNLITVFDPVDVTLLVHQTYRSSQKNDPYLYGMSPLHIACQLHNTDIVKDLIRHDDLLVNEYTSADGSVLIELKKDLYDAFYNNEVRKIDERVKQRDKEIEIEEEKEKEREKEREALRKKGRLDYDDGSNDNYGSSFGSGWGSRNNYGSSFRGGWSSNRSSNWGSNNNYGSSRNNSYKKLERIDREKEIRKIPDIESTHLSVSNNNLYKYGCNALYIACNENQLDIVTTLLLRDDIDLNAKSTKEELTPLLAAVKRGYLTIAKVLLSDERCDPTITSVDKTNILIYACQSHNIELLSLILLSENGRSLINSRNDNNDTPLHYACGSDNEQMIKVLLEHIDLSKVDINAANNQGETPLHLVCKNNNQIIMKILLQKAAMYDNISFDFNLKNNRFLTPMHIVCSQQSRTYYIDDGMIGIIFESLSESEKSSIDFNLQNEKGETPIHLICENNNYQVLEHILNSLSLPAIDAIDFNKTNINGESPIHIICKNGNEKMLGIILDKINLINQAKSDSSMENILDSSKINFNLKDNKGRTPMHLICMNSDNKRVLNVLLEKLSESEKSKIDFNIEDDVGNTPIHYICMGNNDFHLSLIYEKLSDSDKARINFNALNYKGIAPIHYISSNVNDKILNIMLASDNDNVNFNLKDNSGDTPIHYICKKNNAHMLNIIFDKLPPSKVAQIDLNAKNNEGKTPLHIAATFDVPSRCYVLCQEIEKVVLNRKVYENQYKFIDDYKIKTPFGILLENKVDINACDIYNKTPLHEACRSQCYNNIDILLNRKEIVIDGFDKSTPLLLMLSSIIKSKYLNALGYREKTDIYNTNPNSNQYTSQVKSFLNQTLINHIINNKRKAILQKINDNSDSLDSDDENEKKSSITKNEDEDYTLSSSDNELCGSAEPAVFESESQENMMYYIYNKNQMKIIIVETIGNFINKGANFQLFDKDGVSLLLFGIIAQSKKLVKFCMDNLNKSRIPKFLNHRSIYGNPIEIALKLWDKSILEILFRNKKLITFGDKIRDKIIYDCIRNNDTYLMFLLLNKSDEDKDDPNLDFNVNYTVEDKKTLLHLLVEKNNYIGVSILANYSKTNLNLLSNDGKSALHKACDSNDREGYLALSILTRVSFSYIKDLFSKYKGAPSSMNSAFFEHLLSSDMINNKVDINLATKGLTRSAYFRRERQKILEKNPYQTNFHIYYNEPRFNNGFTALHISISNQLYNVVKKILLFPDLDINSFTSNCDTVVSIAAKNWNIPIIKLLLEYPNIDLNFVPRIDYDDDDYDDYGNRIDKNAPKNDSDSDDDRPAHTLSSSELYEIRQKKMKQNKTLLHTACERNSVEMVQYLLDLCQKEIFDINGIDSFDEMAPLHHICRDGKLQLLDLFIEFEKNNGGVIDWNIKDKNGMTPLHLACRSRELKVVDVLINNEYVCPRVDINAVATGEFENGRTPLSFACEKGDLEVVSLLLDEKIEEEKEIDPFSFESDQKEILNKKKVVRGSLCNARKDCDLTIKSKAAHTKGMSPLHFACKASNVEVVKLLLKKANGEYNINLRANGQSCLYLACKHDRVETVKLLLEQEGINYNIKTPTGYTPLMIAAENGRWKIVEMLMQLPEIDVNALTVDGESARSLAKNHDIVDLIDKYS